MRKGMILIFIANIVNLLLSIISGFILPKYLSVEAYGQIKTYQLYLSYVGLLHLGYVDGMYLKYGGEELGSLNKKAFASNLTTIKWFQLLVTIIFLILSVIKYDIVIFAFTASIFAYNLTNYYKFFYQAIGEFEKYSRILNLTSLFTAIGISIPLFLIKNRQGNTYIFIYVLVYFIIYIIVEKEIRAYLSNIRIIRFSKIEFTTSIKNGIVLMFGNLSSILLTSMDRWFVKWLLTLKDFSYYSFAVSIQALVDVFIQPFTITMYNFLCKGFDRKTIIELKQKCLLFGLFIISLAFPVKFILETYLVKYINTTVVLFILFVAQIFYLLIKGIYVNLYKAQNRQKEYFNQLMLIIVIAFILNIIFFYIMKNKESFAIATLISTIIWYILCANKFPENRFSKKEIAIIILSVTCFFVCGLNFVSYVGFILYIGVLVILSLVFMRETFCSLVEIGISILKRRM